MNTFGKNVKISLFGEIYGKTIGLSIDGLPPSYPVNIDKVRKELEEYYYKDDPELKEILDPLLGN